MARTQYGRPGIYNAVAITLADGEGAALALDSSGRVLIAAGTGATSFGKAEDAAHTTGDVGVPFWGVRNDSNTVRTDTNGDYSPVSVDSAGRLKTITATQGFDADNDAVTAAPVLGGSQYNSSAPTYATGDAANLQSDVNGNLKVREQYAPAYEDNTNSKAVVEHRYTSSGSITADTLVKTGAGLVHTITFSCDDAAPTAGSFTLFDNTAESGTEIFSHTFTTTPFMPLSVILDTTFATGLYAGFTTTADVNVIISYR